MHRGPSLTDLPTDVLQHILLYVVGQRTLHVKVRRGRNPHTGHWHHKWVLCICSATISDEVAYAHFSGRQNPPLHAGGEWLGRHNDCETCLECGPVFGLQTSPLSKRPLHTWHVLDFVPVLRTCRLFKGVAEPLIYVTNTFSFSNPTVLAAFLERRSINQRAWIASIALSPVETSVWRHARDKTSVAKQLGQSLQGLRRVHIDLDWSGASGPSTRARRMFTDQAVLERRLRGVLALGPAIQEAAGRHGPKFQLRVTFVDGSWLRADNGGLLPNGRAALIMAPDARRLAQRVRRTLLSGGSLSPDGEIMLGRRYGWVMETNARRQQEARQRGDALYHSLASQHARGGTLSQKRRLYDRQRLSQELGDNDWKRAEFSDGSEDEGEKCGTNLEEVGGGIQYIGKGAAMGSMTPQGAAPVAQMRIMG